MKQNVLKSLCVVFTVLLLIGFVNATSFTKTDVDGGYFRAGVAFPAFQFALTDGGDTTIGGTAPAAGTTITGTKDSDWTQLYFYDGGTEGTWESGSDAIWVDDGKIYYDDGKDTHIAGATTENVEGDTTDYWSSSYYDGNTAGGNFESGNDWIGIDDDNDGVYTSGADTAIDCDGSSTTGVGTCEAHNPGDTLTSTDASDKLCTDNVDNPTIIFIDSDGNCNTADGTITNLTGTADGTYTAVGTEWAYVDTNSNSQYDDGEDLYIENVANELTYSAGADTTIAGTAPSAGTAITSNSSDHWTNLYFYDDGDNTWESGSDIVWQDDGNVYYDVGKDTPVAGITDENTGAGTTSEPAGWNLFYYDATDGNGQFDNANDWIGTDADTNGVYQDVLNNVQISNAGNASNTEYTLTLSQASDCSGTSVDLTWNTDHWEYSSTLGWNQGTYTVCAIIQSGATTGNTIKLTMPADSVIHAGSETLPSADATNGNVQTIDVDAPTATVEVDTPLIYEGDLVQVVTLHYNEPMNQAQNPTISFDGNNGAATSEGDGHWINSTTWQETFNIADVNEETTNVTVSSSNAQDLAGNPEGASTPATFNIDTEAPTFVSLSIIDPNNDGYINAVESQNGTVIAAVTTGVEEGQTVTCYIEDENSNQITNLNGAVNSVNQVTIEVGDLSSLNDGTLTVYCNVSDAAGNAAPQASSTIIKDTIAPTFDIDAIAIDNIVTVNEAENLTINTSSLTDANSVNLTLNIRNSSNDVVYQETLTEITSATATFNNDSDNINISSWNDGPYVVVITATDVAGNPHSENTSFYKFTKTMSELTGGLLDSSSTQLNEENNWTNVSNPVFSTSFGKVEFHGDIDFTETNTLNAFVQLSHYFMMNGTSVSLDAAANALKNLNVTTTITLYDYEDYGITTPVILMNGEICDSSVCSNIDASQTNLGGDSSKKDITFTVQHWTTYQVAQSDSGGTSIKYAYVEDANFDGSPESVYVVFNQPVEILGSSNANDVFELINGNLGTSTLNVVSGEENKVEITLNDASIDYRKLYGTDDGATAIRVKEGQTALVKNGTLVPVVSDTYEDIATGLIYVSNNTAFSVPYCVDMNKIQAEMGSIISGTFQKYVDGKWTEVTTFEPLYGYKYLGTSSFEMPIYTYEDNCDVVPDSIKIAVYNDWNLLGLDDVQKRYAADWLASLTLRSSVQTFIEQLLDSDGDVVADYSDNNNTFGCSKVDPFKAYWIWYNGDDGHMFNGFESDQTTPYCPP